MFEKGTAVYDYEILGPIGSGGLSRNYKANSPDGSIVTLKFPNLDLMRNPANYERFQRELKVGKKLQHPSIPRTFLIIEVGSGTCLVMEYIEGKSLRSILVDRKQLSLEQSLDFIGQLTESLTYLHNNGVYHRDLKPENILIDFQK